MSSVFKARGDHGKWISGRPLSYPRVSEMLPARKAESRPHSCLDVCLRSHRARDAALPWKSQLIRALRGSIVRFPPPEEKQLFAVRLFISLWSLCEETNMLVLQGAIQQLKEVKKTVLILNRIKRG